MMIRLAPAARVRRLIPGIDRYRRGLPTVALGLAVFASHAWSLCSVSSVAVSFGSYNTFLEQPLDGAGQIRIRCDADTAHSIALGTGSGSYSPRTMTSGSHTLFYNLFTDASRSIVWGDGSGSTAVVSGSGMAADYTVYGRIPARQNVHVGSYGDIVTITLTF